MKTLRQISIWLAALAVTAGLLLITVRAIGAPQIGTKSFGADACDASLWQHVYNPSRLQVIKKCVVVTGTIVHSKAEKDGDRHIQLKLDPQFKSSDWLNAQNKTHQGGNLVIEPICVGEVIQPDAIAACKGFKSTVSVPKPGTHVKVVGSFILDTENPGHHWQEIHPVSSIEVLK